MIFSILIAHYNNWDYFQACYQSIIQQTYQEYEIIIVDDCSTDDSFAKLKCLAQQDNRIKLFQNSSNLKVGYTKKRCIDEATGELCGFLDPDDMLDPDALNFAVEAYKNNKSIVATYSKIRLIDENAKPKGIFKFSKPVKNNNQLFFNINFEVAHFFTFKRAIYQQTSGINPELTSSVDQDLYLKLYDKGSFLFINEYHYLYRLHPKGVSQDKSKKEKLKQNWNSVLRSTCKRRGIQKLYGQNLENIVSLSNFIFEKENTFFKKIIRKLL